jgi:hypothetical protein
MFGLCLFLVDETEMSGGVSKEYLRALGEKY